MGFDFSNVGLFAVCVSRSDDISGCFYEVSVEVVGVSGGADNEVSEVLQNKLSVRMCREGK